MRNAAVVNRSLSSGPAGMPNGRSTGMPRNDDFAGEAASPAGTSPAQRRGELAERAARIIILIT